MKIDKSDIVITSKVCARVTYFGALGIHAATCNIVLERKCVHDVAAA